MKRLLMLTVALGLLGVASLRAQSDSLDYRSAMAIADAAARTKTLEAFVAKYPSSKFASPAYYRLFGLYVDQGQESSALDAAHRYLISLAPENLMNAYNDVAWQLAQKNIGLDSALVYAVRSENMARAQGAGMLAAIEDTHAYVLWRKGNSAEAEALQRSAMRGHEDDPDYLGHLALYEEANGKRQEALQDLSQALSLQADPELMQEFYNWLRREEPDSLKRDLLKQTIVMGTVRAQIDSLHGKNTVQGKSHAAAYMATMGVHLPTAEAWARDAVASLGDRVPAEDAVSLQQNLAMVLASEGKDKEAVDHLQAIKNLVSPWSTDFWMTLGKSYERLGDRNDAMNAYLQGLAVTNTPELRERASALYAAEHGSAEGLQAEVDRVRQAGSTIDAGSYQPKGNPTGKVVLAELFTGAECGPCVGADMAFDALRKYYPNSALAILEYHEHIPGPDPMTNTDSWSRFKQYDGTGTPTVVIDGTDKMVGGGPKFIARNRFDLYRYAIDREEESAPPILLSLAVQKSGDEVSINANIRHKSGEPLPARPVLHLALVERRVEYTGSNGITEHALVVRKLLFGPEGTPLSLENASVEEIPARVNLADVEKEVRNTTDNPNNQPSWPKWLRTFSGWRMHPSAMDRSNLALVGWVQDAKTNQVLQAAVEDLSPAMTAH